MVGLVVPVRWGSTAVPVVPAGGVGFPGVAAAMVVRLRPGLVLPAVPVGMPGRWVCSVTAVLVVPVVVV